MNSEKTFERGFALDEIRWEDHENTVFFQPFLTLSQAGINSYYGTELLVYRDYKGNEPKGVNKDVPFFDTLPGAQQELGYMLDDLYDELKRQIFEIKWHNKINREPKRITNLNQLSLL